MKQSARRLTAFLLLVVLLVGTTAAVNLNTTVVSLRIEGITDNLYYNKALATSCFGQATLRDVISSLSSFADSPEIVISNESEISRIVQVGTIKEKSLGSSYNDVWMIRINGIQTDESLEAVTIEQGDDIVIYYGDASLIQHPEIDLTRMIPDGIVQIMSTEAAVDEQGNANISRNPVAGATVVWDGMAYTTNASGEIIIDSTGAGVRHTVSIERCEENGLPTVLRLSPGYTVTYGYDDILKEAWYFEVVMSVSNMNILSGVSATTFAPDLPMNRAMFVTVLGRISGVTPDQNDEEAFSDIVNDGWSNGYISWGVSNGIVSGYSDGTFRQYQKITREQIAVMLYRYAVFSGYDTTLVNSDLSGYTDFNMVSAYAETAVRWANENGIINGFAGRIDPLGTATRAQAAAMLDRFIAQYS